MTRTTTTTTTTHSRSKLPLALALFLSFAWGVISAATGVNALVKSRETERKLKEAVQKPIVVDINVNDVYHSGVVVSVISLLIAISSLLFLLLLLIRPATHSRTGLAPAIVLGFLALWLLATQIALTDFVGSRSARVSAHLGAAEVPQSVIQQVAKAMGMTTVYKKIDYLKLVAILPWFTFLFTTIAALVAFHHHKRAGARSTTGTGATRATGSKESLGMTEQAEKNRTAV